MRSLAYYEEYAALKKMMNASFELQSLIANRVALYVEDKPINDWNENFIARGKEVNQHSRSKYENFVLPFCFNSIQFLAAR